MIVHESVPIGSVGAEAPAAATPGFFTQIATGFAKALPDVAKSAMDIYKTKIDTRSAIRTMRQQGQQDAALMQQQYAQPQYPPGYQPQGAYAAASSNEISTTAIIAMVGGGALFLGLMIVALMPKKAPTPTPTA
jgi:hypothetical protein